jgi:hypothetical protein
MSEHNIKGAAFAILSDKGVYEIYTPDGHPIKGLNQTIRITQQANDLDKIVIIGIVNVVRSKEEMIKIINQ